MILTATLSHTPMHRIIGWLGRDLLSFSCRGTHDDVNHCVQWECEAEFRNESPDPELLKALGDGWKRRPI